MKLLFVCSGNTCRSPLALAAWRALPCPPPGVQASAAGLFAFSGVSVTNHVRTIARTWHVDLENYRAHALNERLLRESDLICVMTPDHAFQLRSRAWSLGLEKHVALLGSFIHQAPMSADEGAARWQALLQQETSLLLEDADDADSILDPFGGSIEAYQSCATQIQRAVTGLSRVLNQGHFQNFRKDGSSL